MQQARGFKSIWRQRSEGMTCPWFWLSEIETLSKSNHYASFCQWTKRVWAHACFVTWMLWLKAAHPISWIYCGKQALMFYVDLSQSCCFPLKLKPQHLIVRWYFLIFRKPTTALISHRNQSVSKLEKLKPWHEVKLSTNKNASNNFEFVVFFGVFFSELHF